ncbi:MAG: HAD family hydrolase [Methylococcales bacterium]|nr:HAD family hydrolase [Methylococcales bacterium]
MENKALFLDRDGIINIDSAYVHQPKDFIFVEGIFDLCHHFVNQGYRLFIITNQAGIGRGYYTEKEFDDLMRWVSAEFSKQGLTIEKSYYCPHHPIAGIGDYKQTCGCRKPEAGMILSAAEEFNLNLNQSLLIGDKMSDINAGKKAGLEKSYLIKSRYQEKYDFISVEAMYHYFSHQKIEAMPHPATRL